MHCMSLQTAPSQNKTKTSKNQNYAWMPQFFFWCSVALHKNHQKTEITLPAFKAIFSSGNSTGKSLGKWLSNMELQEGMSPMRHKKLLNS